MVPETPLPCKTRCDLPNVTGTYFWKNILQTQNWAVILREQHDLKV